MEGKRTMVQWRRGGDTKKTNIYRHPVNLIKVIVEFSCSFFVFVDDVDDRPLEDIVVLRCRSPLSGSGPADISSRDTLHLLDVTQVMRRQISHHIHLEISDVPQLAWLWRHSVSWRLAPATSGRCVTLNYVRWEHSCRQTAFPVCLPPLLHSRKFFHDVTIFCIPSLPTTPRCQ